MPLVRIAEFRWQKRDPGKQAPSGIPTVFWGLHKSTDKCRRDPETHPYFGTRLRVPDSHTFRRTAALGCVSGSNAQKSAAEFEPFLGFAAARPTRHLLRRDYS